MDNRYKHTPGGECFAIEWTGANIDEIAQMIPNRYIEEHTNKLGEHHLHVFLDSEDKTKGSIRATKGQMVARIIGPGGDVFTQDKEEFMNQHTPTKEHEPYVCQKMGDAEKAEWAEAFLSAYRKNNPKYKQIGNEDNEGMGCVGLLPTRNGFDLVTNVPSHTLPTPEEMVIAKERGSYREVMVATVKYRVVNVTEE